MLKRIFIILAVLLLIPMPVVAATYFVSQAGGGDGSACNNARSMAWANTNLTAGDTAYLCDDGGTIATSINPTNDGSAGGGYIIYEEYTGENVVTNQEANMNGKNYIKVKGLHFNQSAGFADMTDSNHCILEGNTYTHPANKIGVPLTLYNSTYGQILENTFVGDGYTEDDHMDWMRFNNASHLLIYGNTIGYCSHTPMFTEDNPAGDYHTVIWGNHIENPWRRNFAFRKEDAGKDHPVRILYHGNTHANTGQENHQNPYTHDNNRVSQDKWCVHDSIYRYNVGYNNDTNLKWPAADLHGADNSWVYHNTWYYAKKCPGHGAAVEGGQGMEARLGTKINNHFINNIMWKYDGDFNYAGGELLFQIPNKGTVNNNDFAYNILGRPDNGGVECRGTYKGTTGTCTQVEAGQADWHDNIFDNPDFTDAPNNDFTLQSDSPAIDAATHLTLTNGTGANSTTLIVDNATPFFSGPGSPWFIDHADIPADTIYIEDTGSVLISSINYGTNTITLDSAKTWGDNKKVYYCPDATCFSGSAPDIGAEEYTVAEEPVPSVTVVGRSFRIITGD